MACESPPHPHPNTASGFFWFSHARWAPPPMHPSTAFPCTPLPRPPHVPCTPEPAGCALGPCNPASTFLCSLAMRSSSWRGPSGRVRRPSRSGWRGCGSRSRRTWSWPSRSARLTCPPPRHGHHACTWVGQRAGCGRRKRSSLYIHSLSAVPVSHCGVSQPCHVKDVLPTGPWFWGALPAERPQGIGHPPPPPQIRLCCDLPVE